MTEQVQNFINSLNRNALRGHKSRAEVARRLVELTDFWSLREMEGFLHEMAGLSFTSHDDRQLFMQFFDCWIADRSSTAPFNNVEQA